MFQKEGRKLFRTVLALPYGQVAAETLLELCIIVVFLKAYNMTRNLFGSQACSPQYALGHAEQIIFLEQLLGIFWEQEIQGAVLHSRTWIRMWNIFYGSAHMAVTVFVLVVREPFMGMHMLHHACHPVRLTHAAIHTCSFYSSSSPKPTRDAAQSS